MDDFQTLIFTVLLAVVGVLINAIVLLGVWYILYFLLPSVAYKSVIAAIMAVGAVAAVSVKKTF